MFYLITADSYDIQKIDRADVVIWESRKHLELFFTADYLVTSQSLPYIGSKKLSDFFNVFNYNNQKRIFLQHGVTHQYYPYENMGKSIYNFDFISCVSNQEKELFTNRFGYVKKEPKNLGFCRFDNLVDNNSLKKSNRILLMPTWRSWLDNISRKNFLESDYYTVFSQILSNKRLLDLLDNENIELVFYPHYSMQKFIDLFKNSEKSRIIIAEAGKYDVQELIIDSNLLITDYSSVLFDYAYLKKPAIYFQFDSQRYFSDHYPKGYFEYDRDGFGVVVKGVDELIDSIHSIIIGNYDFDYYQNKISEFFNYIDNNNCRRTYEAILTLDDQNNY